MFEEINQEIKKISKELENGTTRSIASKMYFSQKDEIENIRNFYSPMSEVPIQSHRKILGWVIKYFKNKIRKLLNWYFEPLINYQIDYTIDLTEKLEEINNKLDKLNEKMN